MTFGFILYALLILAGHIVGFPLAYAYCKSGCGLTLNNVHALQHVGASVAIYANFYMALQVLYVLICVGVAGFIVFKKPGQWVPLLVGLLLLGFAAYEGADYPALTAKYPFLSLPSWVLITLAMSVFGPYALLTFPNGKFAPRWTLWYFLFAALVSFLPPVNTGVLGIVESILFYTGFPIGLGILIYRYRYVLTARERIAMKWPIYSMSIFILTLVLVIGVLPTVAPHDSLAFVLVNTMGFFGCGINIFGVLMAVLYANAFDIDVLIKRTLVYAALTAMVVGLYVLVVGYVGALFRTSNNVAISLIATALVAIVFQPLRGLLQRTVNHLLYGERDDPYAVLARLGNRLEAALVPAKVLPTIVDTIAHALKLPFVAIALLPEQHPVTGTVAGTAGALNLAGTQEADIVASYGAPKADPMRVPLVYQAETIGYLLLAARSGDTFGKQDTRLLTDLARQAGVALYAVRLTTHLQQLTESLQESRERLVTTREEERRRLRRDLHDGLGPALASLTFKVDAARNLLVQGSARAETLLDSVRQLAQEAITDIRRLVYNLRPPALDELGLLSALREQAAHYQHQGLEVDFEVPLSLPPLPAAVEVAVYRIAQEALTNVAHHAQAQHCLLHLLMNHDALHLDIVDDGQGIPAGHRLGIGLHTMHERASELGGSCTITAGSPGGTTIRVRLPLAAATEDVPATSPLEPEQPEQESTLTPDVSLVRQEE
jgi:signal transduction histidine kinase